eukprot:snap_masked-scaffold_3-processed-gene-7.7-mRNA-1 protein AED:1.00 eAED:1.00 QI:0/-1/0/0/-1/1/1/0/415
MKNKFKKKRTSSLQQVGILLIIFLIPALLFLNSTFCRDISVATYFQTSNSFMLLKKFQNEKENILDAALILMNSTMQELLDNKSEKKRYERAEQLLFHYSTFLNDLDVLNSGKDTPAIFFQHIRKSAGTTLMSYLVHPRQKNPVMLSRSFRSKYSAELVSYDKKYNPPFLIHSERRSISRKCFEQVQSKQTLFISAIRHPIERWESEYNYLGLFKKYLKEKFQNSSWEDHLENATLQEQHLHQWINRDIIKYSNWKRKQAIGEYIPNLYTRMFTGECACLALQPAFLYLQLNKEAGATLYNLLVGCPERKRVYQNMTFDDLDKAKLALENFDVVFPQEQLHDQQRIVSIFNSISKRKGIDYKFVVTKDKTEHKKKKKHRIKFADFPSVLSRLESLERLDLELYEFSKTLFKFNFG